MEGLKLRTFIVSGLLLATAGWAIVSPRPAKTAEHDEAWVKKMVPEKVGGYRFQPGVDDPLESYHNPQVVYDTLRPTVGMLARVYEASGQTYDVNLIASRDKASFHDPRVCFTAQNYDITSEQDISIPTKTRGDIPATLAQMNGPNGPSVAVFFYRGPHGFYGSTMSLKLALLWDQVQGRSDLDGVFYRFIPTQDISVDRLVKFVGMFMDESGKSSGGYF